MIAAGRKGLLCGFSARESHARFCASWGGEFSSRNGHDVMRFKCVDADHMSTVVSFSKQSLFLLGK